MNINIEYKEGNAEQIKRIKIDGYKTCAFGTYRQAIDVMMDRKEIRILDIDKCTSMCMDKAELSKYIEVLQLIHDQMEG